MPAPRLVLAAAAALLALPVAVATLPTASAAPPAVPRVVVADIDTGVNPYHEAYYAGGGPYKGRKGPSSVTPAVLKEFGIGPSQVLKVTRTGNFADDRARDKAMWDKVQPGKPYWFAGTNVIGISFEPRTATSTPILADPGDTHGVGTTSAVLNANPDAVVVLVESFGEASEEWAFNHPAVDIVTTSYGFPGSPPGMGHLASSYTGTVLKGKLHFGAADNSPAGSPPDGTSGPWWTIGVAGFHEDTSGGRETLSGNFVDVVADFTQTLPYCVTCETGTRSVSGTSFATPRSAGTASLVLLEARRKAGHRGGPLVRPDGASLMVSGKGRQITPWQVRRALEEGAAYPSMGGYDAMSALLDDTGAMPVADAAPYVQIGWGVLSTRTEYAAVAESLAHLGVRGKPTRTKSDAACDYMTAQHDARVAYWDTVIPSSESFLTGFDPYVACRD